MSFNENEFRQWLVSSSTLSKKALADVISRLRRADSFVRIDGKLEYAKYMELLSKQSDFQNIPESSKSSVARAVKVFYKFLHS